MEFMDIAGGFPLKFKGLGSDSFKMKDACVSVVSMSHDLPVSKVVSISSNALRDKETRGTSPPLQIYLFQNSAGHEESSFSFFLAVSVVIRFKI